MPHGAQDAVRPLFHRAHATTRVVLHHANLQTVTVVLIAAGRAPLAVHAGTSSCCATRAASRNATLTHCCSSLDASARFASLAAPGYFLKRHGV